MPKTTLGPSGSFDFLESSVPISNREGTIIFLPLFCVLPLRDDQSDNSFQKERAAPSPSPSPAPSISLIHHPILKNIEDKKFTSFINHATRYIQLRLPDQSSIQYQLSNSNSIM